MLRSGLALAALVALTSCAREQTYNERVQGLLTQVEYDAIRRQLMEKIKASGDAFPRP